MAGSVDSEPVAVRPQAVDYGGWFGGERPVAVSAEQSAPSVEQTIASNVATADQVDGAAKLMLLIAAAPAAATVSRWNASLPSGDSVVAVKY
ncbi:hypothetical protein J8I87_32725 [Paraburkholderia sp. LEh10]|nr:hypothetical protein [Paraburkholderia sp. LEh10]